MDVLSIGNINVDLSFYIERLPEPDGEGLADLEFFHGGAAANFAVGAARLGLRVGLLGCVGDDHFGREALKELRKEGVAIEFVKTLTGKRTGIVCVLVDRNGVRRMIANRGANAELESAIGQIPDVKFLQLCNVSNKVLMKVKRIALGKRIALDPGGGVMELCLKDLEGIEVLLLNELECRILTGLDYREGSREISKYVKLVVVKMGSRGAYAFDGREEKSQEAFKVGVVDTTGAGDAFDAGFMTALVSGMRKEDCLRWGTAAASLKIQRRGARGGLPTINELNEFLSRNPQGL